MPQQPRHTTGAGTPGTHTATASPPTTTEPERPGGNQNREGKTVSATNSKAKNRAAATSAANKSAPARAPKRPADQEGKSKPVSMPLMPHEHAELEEFTALTGIGPTTLYRNLVAPKVHTAVWALKEMAAAGVEIRAHNLPPTTWHPESAPGELDDLYSGLKPSNDLAD